MNLTDSICKSSLKVLQNCVQYFWTSVGLKDIHILPLTQLTPNARTQKEAPFPIGEPAAFQISTSTGVQPIPISKPRLAVPDVDSKALQQTLDLFSEDPLTQRGLVGAIENLSTNGANFTTDIIDLQTQLVFAAYIGDTTAIEKNIQAGANAHTPNKHGIKPIDIAAARGHGEAIRAIVLTKQ